MSSSEIEIPILYGSSSDLTKLDLSFINAKIIVYRGTKFREFFKNNIYPLVFKHSYDFAISDDEDNRLYKSNKIKEYAIIPIDITKPFNEDFIYHFYRLLLSVFPSDISIIKEISLSPLEKKYQTGTITTYPFNPTGDNYIDNFLYIERYEYKFFNNFLKTYFHSSYNLKYLKYILSVYANSYREYNPIYQFISLMICLEVIVEGTEQLSYRVKRNTAILCGNSVKSCTRIYENVNQLYKLRSAIVHGVEIKASFKNFKEYHQYLKKLVARLIRELIAHNIPTVSELNDKLTELGYGQNALISKSYKPSKYPFIDNMQLSYKAIQKY